MKDSDLKDFDRRHLWHPYTSMVDPQTTLVVDRAEGCRLILDDGTELIDGMASWWAAIQGYNHAGINAVLAEQAADFSHVMFGGLTHAPAVGLGKRLLEIVPAGLDAIFYSDSGSVAVEVGLKMALQYWQGVGRPEKNRLMTLSAGYHGDTFATMALSDRTTGMHQRFGDILCEPVYLDRPPPGFAEPVPQPYRQHLERQFEVHAGQCAAMVLEPVVQNAGGMNIYNPEVLRCIRSLCDQYGVLLILDEIATGFGRTGTWFACEHAGIEPDILCIGKSMTAGYLSFAATLTTRTVAEGISGDTNDPLMHGPTYMGNALAARVAAHNIELLQQGDWQARVSQIESGFRSHLGPLRTLPNVVDVRVLGAIGVVEVDRSVNLERVRPVLLESGVWLRPFRNLIYSMPPFIIDRSELGQVCGCIARLVESQSY